MLVVCFRDGEDATWHINEGSPIDTAISELERSSGKSMTEPEHGIILGRILNDVYMLQADGDELEHIKRQYKNHTGPDCVQPTYTIPMDPNKKIMKWHGDIARTILLNL